MHLLMARKYLELSLATVMTSVIPGAGTRPRPRPRTHARTHARARRRTHTSASLTSLSMRRAASTLGRRATMEGRVHLCASQDSSFLGLCMLLSDACMCELHTHTDVQVIHFERYGGDMGPMLRCIAHAELLWNRYAMVGWMHLHMCTQTSACF